MAYGNSLQRRIYYNSPHFLKSTIASVYGWIQQCERYGNVYKEYCDVLRQSQWYRNDQLEEIQFGRVKELLTHAKTHCEYYKHLFKECKFEPQQMRSFSDIRGLPLLDKETVRTRIGEIIPDNVAEYRVRWAHTSGTTGTGLQFPLSSECFQREYAFKWLQYLWGGIREGDRFAYCMGHPVAQQDRQTPPFWVYDYTNKSLLLSSYHLSDRNVPYYLSELEKYQADLIVGYPSSVYLLAIANERYGQRVRPRAVYTASETLFDFQRATIEESFGCKVFMWYGNSEMCANIVECERGKYHLKLEHSYVEVLNGRNQVVSEGEEGRLVCTGFGNYAFPLIRYSVGDVVVLSKQETCECGRGGRLVDRIEGRTEDYIVTPDGRVVGRLDHLFKDVTHVRLAQIEQNEVDEIVIRIVKDVKYNSEDEHDIVKQTRLRLGSNMRVRFEYVDEIGRTSSGKYRFIISNIQNKSTFWDVIRCRSTTRGKLPPS